MPLPALVAGAVKVGAVVGKGALSAAKVMGRAGASVARATARGAVRGGASGARDFIKGKKKKVKPDAIKKRGGIQQYDESGALVVRPQTSMVPSPVNVSAITPVSGAKMVSAKGGSDSEEDIIKEIRVKVIEIDKILKGTLAQQKTASKKDRKSDEKQRRKRQEKILEKSTPKIKGSGLVKKLTAPAKGLFGGIFDFLKNILIGRLLVLLLENKPNLPGGNILMFIAGLAEKVIDMIIGVLDAVGGFLAWGQEKLDGARQWLVDNKGEEAGKRFDGLLSALTNLLNAAVIVGSAMSVMGMGPRIPAPGGDQAKKAAQKAAQKAAPLGSKLLKTKLGKKLTEMSGGVIKHSAGRTVKRAGLKLIGKKGVKLVSKMFGKIPIVGPLIVAVSSLLAGEPPGQALFKAGGAMLGGLLGSFIPIPVIGTLLGETIGVFVGDLLYSLILGGGPEEAGQKFMDAFKTALDVGGLIVNFFKEGFGRFFKDFPTVDISKIWMLPRALGAAAGLLGLEDLKSPNGKVEKLPNLSILFNPYAMITELIPHAAKSFFPDLFGGSSSSGGSFISGEVDEDDESLQSGDSGGRERKARGPSAVRNQGRASGNIRGKGNAIYLHWTAGNYDSIYGPYHTVFTGDGTMHRKSEYDQHVGHTYGRNSNSVGLSLAANPTINQWPTEAQKESMAKEAARIAKGWGWSASDINLNKVMTHGEAGSNLDGVNAHTMYGLYGRGDSRVQPDKEARATGRVADFERWDLDILKPGEKYGSGGDEMRERIRKFMTGGDSEEESPDGKMAKGGLIKKQGRYEMGEEGPEFVIDADTYNPIEKMMPGLFDAINAAKGKDAIGILMSFAGYEEPASDELVMVGGSGGGSSYGDGGSSMRDIQLPSTSDSGSNWWKDIRYKFG
jgi:hypothetical protein